MSQSSSHQPFGAPAEPPLTPLARGCLWLAGLLALLLIGVVVNYLVHGGTEGLNPVAEAAEKTAATPGSRLRMEITYTVAGTGRSVTGNGAGVFDSKSGRARVALSVPGADGAMVKTESVGDARTVYLRSSALAAQLPADKEWLAMQPLLGHDPQTAFGGDGAKGTLGMLEATGGGVEEVDHESVHGHPTTRYRAKVEMSKVAGLARQRGQEAVAQEYEAIAAQEPDPIPVEVWVDEAGLARLVRMTEPLPTSGGGPSVTMDMRMEFFNFGPQKKIVLPPRRRVLDWTPVMRAELGMLDGRAFGPLLPPRAAKAPRPTAFRHATEAICRRVVARARALFRVHAGAIAAVKGLDREDLGSERARSIGRAYGRQIEEPAFRIIGRGTLELARVRPPVGDAADYRRYLELDAMQAEWALAQARALQLGAFKVPGFEARKDEVTADVNERKRLAAKLGIAGACEKGAGSGSPSQPA